MPSIVFFFPKERTVVYYKTHSCHSDIIGQFDQSFELSCSAHLITYIWPAYLQLIRQSAISCGAYNLFDCGDQYTYLCCCRGKQEAIPTLWEVSSEISHALFRCNIRFCHTNR